MDTCSSKTVTLAFVIFHHDRFSDIPVIGDDENSGVDHRTETVYEYWCQGLISQIVFELKIWLSYKFVSFLHEK